MNSQAEYLYLKCWEENVLDYIFFTYTHIKWSILKMNPNLNRKLIYVPYISYTYWLKVVLWICSIIMNLCTECNPYKLYKFECKFHQVWNFPFVILNQPWIMVHFWLSDYECSTRISNAHGACFCFPFFFFRVFSGTSRL